MTPKEQQAEHSALIARLRKEAEAGGREAARFLLDEFVLHSRHIAESVNSSDATVIAFLAEAISKILQGKDPALALCIDKPEGRQQIPIERDLSLAFDVFSRLDDLSVKAAIATVATERGIGMETVKAAWRKYSWLPKGKEPPKR